MLDKKTVVVGMSGGVDSTVAAYLLKEKGYRVIGVTMKLWDDPSEDYVENYGGCCSLSSVEDARRVCDAMDIPFYVVNFKTDFKAKVIDYFVDAYRRGQTPNPCVKCNIHIKFDKLLDKAFDLGAYYVATGHYAKVLYDSEKSRFRLFRSCERTKDQTYMLASLNQKQLAHVIFPLGEFSSKEQVRKIAVDLDYIVAKKSDSQEICFIPDNNYAKFVIDSTDVPITEGDFVDVNGNIIGRHKGLVHYTIGQRKGLGQTFGKPMYVLAINPNKNQVVLGEHDDVFSGGLIAREVNLITDETFSNYKVVQVRIRHSQRGSSAKMIALSNGRYKILFDLPERAVTPGQAIAFYRNDEVLGGGVIESSYNI